MDFTSEVPVKPLLLLSCYSGYSVLGFLSVRTYAAKRLKPCSSAIHRRWTPLPTPYESPMNRDRRATTIEVRKSCLFCLKCRRWEVAHSASCRDWEIPPIEKLSTRIALPFRLTKIYLFVTLCTGPSCLDSYRRKAE